MEQKNGNIAAVTQKDSISANIINIKSIFIVIGLVLVFIASFYLFN